MTIYYVEDNKELGEIVSKYLSKEGYKVVHFYTGEAAIRRINDIVDLWILDIMLPGSINGYQLIEEIKKRRPDIPVIFTSARDQDIDKVTGLEMGSDDYVAKPFSPKELVLRVKAILRRQGLKNYINQNGYNIDIDKRIVLDGKGAEISLTSKEFDLLLLFINNKNNLLTREDILDKVWNMENEEDKIRIVDDLLRRLRSKMPNIRIETIYGKGYKLL